MPCKKCENGKYKWGETGDCQYDTLEACRQDHQEPEGYEEMKTTRIVELIIEDDNQELAIDAISLVSAPAIEQDFVFFGKDRHNLTFAKVDEDKRMLVSPALIPNKQIFRHDPNTDSDYYVYFSKDTVRKAAELYLRHNNHHKATYEHSERVAGVLTVESWIKEGDQDKSKMFGYDLPNGTWFVKMKIENDELWSKIKDGELKGLSIEGYFVDKMQQMSERQPTDHEILSALNEMLQSKTELKSEKVELGLVDDITKVYKSIKQKYKETESVYKKSQIGSFLKNAAKLDKKRNDLISEVKDHKNSGDDLKKINEKLNKEAQELKKISNKGSSLIKQANAAGKELGVNPKNIPNYSELIEIMDLGLITAKDKINEADDSIKVIDKNLAYLKIK